MSFKTKKKSFSVFLVVTIDYTMLGQTGFGLLTQIRVGSKTVTKNILLKKIFYSKNPILSESLIKRQEIKETEGISMGENLFSLLQSV